MSVVITCMHYIMILFSRVADGDADNQMPLKGNDIDKTRGFGRIGNSPRLI